MKAPKQQCKAMKPDGSRCRAAALPDSDFCFFHDPSKAAERREAHAAGGRQNRMKTLDTDVPDVEIKDCKDVVALLSETINQVRKGLIDPRVANSVGYLANQVVRVLAQDELADRIERLEQLVTRRSNIPDLLITGKTNVKAANSQTTGPD
jgi:hypothetical protein